jgi:ubiquinone/menaquinone biosynthesis C-methylase UbiE
MRFGTNNFTMTAETRNTTQHYDRLSQRYDRAYSSYLRHTHNYFMKRLDLSPQDRVLDVSAGTGLLAAQLLDQHGTFERLVLNDPSEQMLLYARKRLKQTPKAEFTHYYARELPFAPNSFSVILCLNAFHYYADQQTVVKLFHTMLKPGGRVFILDWNRTGIFRPVNQLIRWFSPEFINTRSSEEMEQFLKKSGFTVNQSEAWRFRWWNLFFLKSEKS